MAWIIHTYTSLSKLNKLANSFFAEGSRNHFGIGKNETDRKPLEMMECFLIASCSTTSTRREKQGIIKKWSLSSIKFTLMNIDVVILSNLWSVAYGLII